VALTGRQTLALAGLVLAAVVWGVSQHVVDGAPGGAWLSALGAPWLVLAFAAGAMSGKRAPVVGALSLFVAVGAYYIPFLFMDAGVARYAVKVGLAWGIVAAALGALFGAAGAAWRRDPRSTLGTLAAALPVGALAGEALLLRREWFSAGAPEALRVELTAAVLVAAFTIRRPLGFAAALIAALTAGVAADELRDLLRAAGWQGA
jgi:hypothetical protein